MGDINNQKNFLALWDSPSNEEGHVESGDISVKSNVVDEEHPILSSSGIIATINAARSLSNSTESQLSGKVPDDVFKKVTKASFQYKITPDLIMFMMDWDSDITSGSGDPDSVANKILGYIPQLRDSLGRDPMYGEIFCAYATGDASKVKTLQDLAENSPEDEATPDNSTKSDIIYNKTKGSTTKKRVNREVYDFFFKRMGNGRISYNDFLGQKKVYT